MVTIVAILPERSIQTGISYLLTSTQAYPGKVKYMEITDIADIPDDKPIIFFHPRSSDNNPEWLKGKVEDFETADIPEDSYWIVNNDYGSDITQEVEIKAHYLIEKSRWMKIEVTDNQDYKSLHGHQAIAICLWLRYYKKIKPPKL